MEAYTPGILPGLLPRRRCIQGHAKLTQDWTLMRQFILIAVSLLGLAYFIFLDR
jgi:hypothetical protein